MGDDQRESVRLWRAEVQEGVLLHDVLVVAFGEAPVLPFSVVDNSGPHFLTA
jgi:hypothetical protein